MSATFVRVSQKFGKQVPCIYFALLFAVVVYQVMIVTGDVWNASTHANVYLTMYGINGDTGVHQLLNSSNSEKFLKGQVNTHL